MNEKGQCPCGSGKIYPGCCGPYLEEKRSAPTAEALMRSRYSAYALNNEAYILGTWHPSTAPASINQESMSVWSSLEILETESGMEHDESGIVEFRATAVTGRKIFTLHERSSFVKEGGEWLYLDGEVFSEPEKPAAAKTGRNDPCPCGSGKKFKKCCGR